ncbi:MAG: amidohydrolase [Opitutales bacterium]|nr:amidohydrolase [Opitutales bacterium]
MIIDSHTHLFPSVAVADPREFARSRNEVFWGELMAPSTGRSLQGWVSPDEMLHAMDESGIERAVLMGWYWEHPATCVEQNRWYARMLEQEPGRWHAFASIHPLDRVSAMEELRFAVDHGFKGIGEVHPAVQGFSLRDPSWIKVAEFASEHGLVINLHVTEPVGRPYKPKAETEYEDIQWLVERFPDLKIILAHWGGLVLFHELNPYVRKLFRNVYYDTAASPLLYDPGLFNLAVEAVGPEKLLYGSDYPLMLYPRFEKEPGFARFVDEIREVVPDTRVLGLILGGNARRIFS